MNLPDINPNLPCLRPLTCARRQNRHVACSTNSIPVLIQLCIHPDENYACRTMHLLFSSRYRYSPNVCDEFGCNILMYSLRYQRYKLFEFLLKEISVDLNFRAKDRQGNTILHYAILYGGKDTQIIDRLIEKYKKFAIGVDERNTLGYTPLLLAVFCGRYHLALALLTKTDASPFVRDYIQLKNMFDYIAINSQQSPGLSHESKHQRLQLHQTLPSSRETSFHAIQHHKNKNFFETLLPQAVQDQTGSIRSSIMKMFNLEYFPDLLNYLNRRYPRVKTPQRQESSSDITTTTKHVFQRENSKTNLHHILQIYDPDLRFKAIPPVVRPAKIEKPTTKTLITFRRLGTKIGTLSAFSRSTVAKKRASIEVSNTN